MNDRLWIECPECEEHVPITCYTGPKQHIDFYLDDAPLTMIAEANKMSREGTIGCTHCGVSIIVIVRYIAYCRPATGKFKVGWKKA